MAALGKFLKQIKQLNNCRTDSHQQPLGPSPDLVQSKAAILPEQSCPEQESMTVSKHSIPEFQGAMWLSSYPDPASVCP